MRIESRSSRRRPQGARTRIRWSHPILIVATALTCAGAALAGTGPDPSPSSPDGLWRAADEDSLAPAGMRVIVPKTYRVVTMDRVAFQRIAVQAPLERTDAARSAKVVMSLPLPDGTFGRFQIEESPIMEPALAARFPEIHTYSGQGLDDPTATTRLGWTSGGFHAIVLGASGTSYVDPYRRGDTETYLVYAKSELARDPGAPFECLAQHGASRDATLGLPAAAASNGAVLRTYRLALAADGEYTQFHGGTKALALNDGIIPAMNRVDGVYERELSIRMVLVAGEMDIIWEQPLADPYVDQDGLSMLYTNQQVLDALIGSANYDIGHVFSTGGGGVAGLGVVCADGFKGEGVTGHPTPTGDAFWIDYVAHEMGHEFGGNHTFNGTTGSCGGGNRNAGTAWEVGSGSTIMPYAGICGAEDLQPHSDDYFHVGSLDEIIAYTTASDGDACAVKTPTGNQPPTVDAGPSFTIPARTPFALTATGSDPDGDPITFCWEEFDIGAQGPPNDDLDAERPILRSFSPTVSPTRTFPRLADLLGAQSTFGESLPTRSRTMQFRVTGRDNRADGGGVGSDQTSVLVAGAAGPFVVTSPQTPVTWTIGSTRNVTWDVAGTTASPVNAASVDILLSTDGGATFPITLAAGTANDGAQTITVPSVTTTQARVKVQGTGNIFFDVNDADLQINAAAPAIDAQGTLLTSENCGSGNAAVDPDETVTVAFTLSNEGTADTTNLLATLLPTGGVTLPSAPRSYGALAAGGAGVTRTFTFKAAGACGGSVTVGLDLNDDGAPLGVATFTLPLGEITSESTPFVNAAAQTIPPQGPMLPNYPSSITVSGVTGTVRKVTATLTGLDHAYGEDLDVLLVGPGGQTVMLMSDAAGTAAFSGDITFDDDAAGPVPNTTTAPGTYRPTDYGTTDNLLPPAPQRPYGTALSVFEGLSPNGTWSLYLADDAAPDAGSLGGWRLTVYTSDATCCVFSGAPLEASGATNMTAARGPGSSVQVAYTPACGASDHAIYSGSTPIAGALGWTGAACGLGASGTATFDPGTPSPGQLVYFVIVGQNTSREGSYGRDSSGSERPQSTGLGPCDRPQDLSGSCP